MESRTVRLPRTLVATVALIAVAVLTTATAATAAPAHATATRTVAEGTVAGGTTAGGTIGAPEPQAYPPFDDPAGDPCPFALHGEFPVNHVVGIPYTDASGRVVAEVFTGALFLKLTRVDTGKTVTLDLSGSGVERNAADGSFVLYGLGPFASTQHPGDRPGPEFAVLHGISALKVAADGRKTILYSSRVENVCRELA